MKLTAKKADEILGLLDMFGTPEVAAHQCRVQLQAIRPYTSRDLSRSIEILDYLSRFQGDRRVYLITQLATAAYDAA